MRYVPNRGLLTGWTPPERVNPPGQPPIPIPAAGGAWWSPRSRSSWSSNTSQQVGGSIGTALLNTVATTSSAAYITAHLTEPAQRESVTREGSVHGYRCPLGGAVQKVA